MRLNAYLGYTGPVKYLLDEALRAEIEGESYFYPRENIVPDSPDKSGSSNKALSQPIRLTVGLFERVSYDKSCYFFNRFGFSSLQVKGDFRLIRHTKEHMASNKNQHYVPQCYLRRFSAENSTSVINIFNIDREKFINCAPIKSQCSKSYFYGDDLELEKALQPIEARYSGIVREITTPGYTLTNQHREFLIFFWRLQYMRTEAASRRSIEITAGMEEVVGIETPDFKMEMKEAVQLSMKNFVKERSLLNDLKVCLIKNKSKVNFITSDDPAVLTNKWHVMDKRTAGSNFGLGSAGVIITLPITPNILCVGFDPHVYSIPHKNGWVNVKNEREIMLFNEQQFLNSRANIFFQSWNSQEQLLGGFTPIKARRPKSRHKIHYAVLDEESDGFKKYKVVDWREAKNNQEAMIHTEMVNPIPSAWPHTIGWKRKGFVYTNGSGVGYVRESRINPATDHDFVKENSR